MSNMLVGILTLGNLFFSAFACFSFKSKCFWNSRCDICLKINQYCKKCKNFLCRLEKFHYLCSGILWAFDILPNVKDIKFNKYMKKILLLFAAAICAVASWAADVVTAKYNGNKLDVELTNTTPFVAFQMDITVPAGVTLQGTPVSNIERLAQGENVLINSVSTPTPFQLLHNVISSDAEKQVIRVIAYNLGNNEIKNATGKLFTLNFDADVTEASIDNILFVDQALVEQSLAKAIAEKGGKLGDIDGDGFVDTVDITIALQIAAGKIGKIDAADIDGDGYVDTVDVTMILQIVAGKI